MWIGRIYLSIFHGKYKNTFDCDQNTFWFYIQIGFRKEEIYTFLFKTAHQFETSSLINANDLLITFCACTYCAVSGINPDESLSRREITALADLLSKQRSENSIQNDVSDIALTSMQKVSTISCLPSLCSLDKALIY